MEAATLSLQQRPAIELRGAASILQTCDARRVLIEGRAGTGKTAGCLVKVNNWCEQYPKLRAAFVRETAIDVKKTILKTFEEFVLPEHSLLKLGQSRLHRTHYTYDNDSFIGIFGLDEPADLFSSEWDLIYAAEGIQFEQGTVDLLSRSLRNFKGPYHQLMIDVNPGPPGHWLNKRSTPAGNELRDMKDWDAYQRLLAWNQRPVDHESSLFHRLISVHQDNPEYFHLDEDAGTWFQKQRGTIYLRGLMDIFGHNRQRMLHGLWTAAEGAVYPEFNEDVHVIEPFPIPRDWPVYVAKDPGRDHPDATLFMAVAPNERHYLIAESCVRETTTSQDAATLTMMCKPFRVVRKLGDPHYMFSLTKMSDTGRTIAEQMRDFGHVFEPAPAARNQTEIGQQVDMVRTKLTTIGSDGLPMLQVFRSCTNTINGFQSWGYQRDHAGQIKGGEDKFEDRGDDEMDCVRMLIASRPTFARPTVKVYDSSALG